MVILRHVGQAMSGRGLTVRRHVDLVLSDATDLLRRGLFAGNPHVLGVTRASLDHKRRAQGPITIGIVSGLPDEVFRAVLVHEFAHAFFAGLPHKPVLQDRVEEGFAEALAFLYLEQDLAGEGARRRMTSMMANPDPVYGEGLRLMLPAVRREGAATVAQALAEGNLAVIGPQAPRAGTGPRRTRPVKG